ncbi:MAG TPA: TRAP transporter small permease [Ramlibacter sp.]|nr:TRAP transporter small permease [Ramlibacter sp.]
MTTLPVDGAVLPARSAMGLERWLRAASLALAYAGGAIVLAIALLSCASVAMRQLAGRPILGDFEIVQMGSAACVALFLPWCQWERGNVAVTFCTDGLAPGARARLDAIGNLLVAVFALVVLWRAGIGLAGVRAAGESGMVSGVPLWWGYVPLAPGFALLAVNALYRAWQDWRGAAR